MSWNTIEIKRCDQGYMVTVCGEEPSYWVYADGASLSGELTTTTYAIEEGTSVVGLILNLLGKESDSGA